MVKGKSAYLLSALVNTVRGITSPYTITLDNGQVLDGRKTLVCIANGRWYGGCFNPVPEAMPDDGLLDVLSVEPVTRMTVAAAIGRYQHGQYAQYPNLIRHHQCRSLRIQCPEPEGVNLDGELLFSKELKKTWYVCPKCGHHLRLYLDKRLKLLFDGNFTEIKLPETKEDGCQSFL